jgi:hypothetical protein
MTFEAAFPADPAVLAGLLDAVAARAPLPWPRLPPSPRGKGPQKIPVLSEKNNPSEFLKKLTMSSIGFPLTKHG